MPINFVTQGVQLQNPLAQAAQVEQIRNYQTANALSQMKMAAAQKQIEDEKTLNALYQSNIGPDGQINRNGLLSGMAQRGMGSKAPALMKQFAEYDKLQNDNQTSFYNGLKAEQEAAKSELENIDPEDPHLQVKLAQWMSRVDKLPLTSKFNDSLGMTSDKRSQIIKQVLENPQTAKDAYYRSAQGLDKALQMHYVNQDLGGSVQTVAMPANHPGTAQVVPGTSFAKSMTPDQVSKQSNRVDANKAKFKEVDNAGNVTFYNNQGQPISRQEGAGKPSATYEKTQNDKAKTKRDLEDVVTELEGLTSKGKSGKEPSLIEQSTGSGFGTLVDWTQNLVGKTNAGQLALGRIQPIADKVLKMVPRFEGPQSDADTRSYKEAAGQLANSRLPVDVRQTAATEILRLMKKRKGQFAQQGQEENLGSTQTPSSSVPTGNVPPPTPPPGRAQVGANTLNQSIDQMNPDDQAALAWANANPKDPRAAQIKLHLGVK